MPSSIQNEVKADLVIGQTLLVNCQWVIGHSSVVSGRLSVVSGRWWRIVGRRLSRVIRHWPLTVVHRALRVWY